MRASIAQSWRPASRAISPRAHDASANSTSASPRHERERLAQVRRRAGRGRAATAPRPTGRCARTGGASIGVRVDREHVAAGPGHERVRTDHLPDVVHVGLERVRERVGGSPSQRSSTSRSGGTSVCGWRSRSASRPRGFAPLSSASCAVDPDLQRTQDAELHGCFPLPGPRRDPRRRGDDLRLRSSVRRRSGREHGLHGRRPPILKWSSSGVRFDHPDGDPGRNDCKGRAGSAVKPPRTRRRADEAVVSITRRRAARFEFFVADPQGAVRSSTARAKRLGLLPELQVAITKIRVRFVAGDDRVQRFEIDGLRGCFTDDEPGARATRRRRRRGARAGAR